MAAGTYNFLIEQGATFTRIFKYKDSFFKIQFRKIINSLEFENMLTIQAIWIKFSIEMCENLRIKYLSLQDLIEKK